MRLAAENQRVAKAKVKDERSQETARQAREQQERGAHIRMAKDQITQMQDKYLEELHSHNDPIPTDSVIININWPKKKGVSRCLFCDEAIKYYFFRCPDGGAVACNPCKHKLSRFVPPKPADETAEKDEEISEVGEMIKEEVRDEVLKEVMEKVREQGKQEAAKGTEEEVEEDFE